MRTIRPVFQLLALLSVTSSLLMISTIKASPDLQTQYHVFLPMVMAVGNPNITPVTPSTTSIATATGTTTGTSTTQPTASQTATAPSLTPETSTPTSSSSPTSTMSATATASNTSQPTATPSATSTATATASSTSTATVTASSTSTATAIASATSTATATRTTTPTKTPTSATKITTFDTGILGFTDASTRQIVRTSSGQVYFFVQEVYQNIIRAYRANTTGTPSSFSEMDGGNRPSAASTIWAVDSAIDSSGIVHVLANTEAGPVLYYTFNTNTNKWSGATQVASSAWPSFSGIRQGSASIALVLDSNAIAHVVYSKTVNGFRRVYYNNNQGGSWSHEALVDNQPALQNSHATLAFGPDGTLYAAWFANNGGAGSIYASVRRSSSWSSPALIGDGAWGDAGYSLDQGPALLVSPNGQVHIAYINGWEPVSSAPSGYEYGRVKHFYSSNAGASWISDDPPTRFSHSPSLATDPQSNLYIFGHREQWKAEHCADMYIVAQPSGSGWGTWRELARGCLDSSVTAKWSQYNWNNPEILDFLYWTEHGPNGESDYNKLYYGEIRGGLNAINSLPAAPAP